MSDTSALAATSASSSTSSRQHLVVGITNDLVSTFICYRATTIHIIPGFTFVQPCYKQRPFFLKSRSHDGQSIFFSTCFTAALLFIASENYAIGDSGREPYNGANQSYPARGAISRLGARIWVRIGVL